MRTFQHDVTLGLCYYHTAFARLVDAYIESQAESKTRSDTISTCQYYHAPKGFLRHSVRRREAIEEWECLLCII